MTISGSGGLAKSGSMGVARVAMTAGFVTVAAGIGLWVSLLIYPSNHVPGLRPLFYAQLMLGVYVVWVLYNVENDRLGPTPGARWAELAFCRHRSSVTGGTFSASRRRGAEGFALCAIGRRLLIVDKWLHRIYSRRRFWWASAGVSSPLACVCGCGALWACRGMKDSQKRSVGHCRPLCWAP